MEGKSEKATALSVIHRKDRYYRGTVPVGEVSPNGRWGEGHEGPPVSESDLLGLRTPVLARTLGW